MRDRDPPRLDADELMHLARQADPGRPCPACAALVCPGWESMPAGHDAGHLECVGTLVPPPGSGQLDDHGEPTLREYHPHGTHGWSPDAPIAPHWYPYNRCDVWRCRRCERAYLRYTEFGGYYVDERVRALDPACLDNTAD
ncbi:MAG: hypothetical protein RL375_919 [Pseudomonadota bacterium]|jgi:hypothetical protein